MPVQYADIFVRIVNNLAEILPERTRREMLAGYQANRTSGEISDDGRKWLNSQFPEYFFITNVVGRHTVLMVYSDPRLQEPLLVLEEPTLEFISPQLFAKISLVCG